MTNETKCPLANSCKYAGQAEHCTDNCSAFITVMDRIEIADIPLEYRDITIENSPANDDQQEIYKALEAYLRSFEVEGVRVKSVYLFSRSPGTGKTTTACALLNEFIRRRFIYHIKQGERIPTVLGLFLDINAWQTRYNLASMTDDEDEIQTIKNDIIRCSSVPMLVIDDIGIRSATEAFRSYVHAIVNNRLTNHLPTIYTSNLPLSDMETVFDPRLYDRLRDQCTELTFKGGSKRGVRR
ncbi:DnaC-like helicase loader [Bacillus phage Mgbh1]|uniref:DNA replication-like protein n=1 Tax=Bacillus phage Mgbh1 TaxID=1796993 RepID=A0A142F1P9_9CAUD|nr:DnaC-like helicase loader [Bacillus phage Mgbh1]AMQ66706.1 DNA replication-like protein [Bacillus phage Mgbh1]